MRIRIRGYRDRGITWQLILAISKFNNASCVYLPASSDRFSHSDEIGAVSKHSMSRKTFCILDLASSHKFIPGVRCLLNFSPTNLNFPLHSQCPLSRYSLSRRLPTPPYSFLASNRKVLSHIAEQNFNLHSVQSQIARSLKVTLHKFDTKCGNFASSGKNTPVDGGGGGGEPFPRLSRIPRMPRADTTLVSFNR